MKKLFIFLIIAFSCTLNAFSARGIGAFLSHSTFYIPGQSPYVEMYLEIIGNTLKYKQTPTGLFQGSIQVTMIIKQDSVIKDFKKYELLSAEVEDTTGVGVNFIDQQRFILPNGDYVMEFSIADNNVNKKPETLLYPFTIDFPSDKQSMSDIQLINSYTKTTKDNILSKSGYDLVPLVDNFFPSSKNKLTFYSEIYNPAYTEDSDEKFLISYYIESFENHKILNEYARSKREISKLVTVVLNEFDITSLPSGNYNLVISLRDKANNILASNSAFFQRSNPAMNNIAMDYSKVDLTNAFASRITSADTLREYIRSLTPIATEMEKVFINHQSPTAELATLQQYFEKFWESRDIFDPETAWEKYNIQVQRVNKAYGTQVRKGYYTDMGNIYLKYGEPSTIQDMAYDVSNLSGEGSVPYQIWHYYSLNEGRERNKRFVFINSEVGAREYTLVHSDVKGEIQNWNWQSQLVRGIGVGDIDESHMKRDQSRSGTIYNNPF